MLESAVSCGNWQVRVSQLSGGRKRDDGSKISQTFEIAAFATGSWRESADDWTALVRSDSWRRKMVRKSELVNEISRYALDSRGEQGGRRGDSRVAGAGRLRFPHRISVRNE